MKSKNRNLYIIFGVIVIALVLVIVWLFMTKKDESKDLELEGELVRKELEKLVGSQQTSQKEQFQQPPPPQPPKAKPALVTFHAGYCGYCKEFMPLWEQLKKQIPQDKVNMLDFQMEKEPEIIQQNNVSGFPEIRLYPEGFPSSNFIPYKGNRQPDSIMRFVMSGGTAM